MAADADAPESNLEPLGGVSAATDTSDGSTLQMVATSSDVDMLQRSPIIRHEEYARLELAVHEHEREVLLGLRRAGTGDDLVVRSISARLDLEQVRVQGIETVE